MFLNAKKYLRLKKLHLNTFFLIENVFFDWSNLFCVWTMLWVGHLCLNYSIPKKLLQSKKKILKKKKNIFNKRKNCLNAKKKKIIWSVFFLIELSFFLNEVKKVLKSFFFLNHFDTNVPQWAGASPLVRHVWVTSVYTNDVFLTSKSWSPLASEPGSSGGVVGK